MYQRVRS